MKGYEGLWIVWEDVNFTWFGVSMKIKANLEYWLRDILLISYQCYPCYNLQKYMDRYFASVLFIMFVTV